MNIDWILEILKEINIAQLIAIGAMIWFFYQRLEKKIDKVNERIDKVNERIDKLSEKVEDIDRRLCRIEGSLQTQGHCLFNQSHNDKKVS